MCIMYIVMNLKSLSQIIADKDVRKYRLNIDKNKAQVYVYKCKTTFSEN